MSVFTIRGGPAPGSADGLSYSARGCRCGAIMQPSVDERGTSSWRCAECGRTHRR